MERERILVPVDGSECAQRGVLMAGEIAAATGWSVDLLYVSYFEKDTDPEDEVSWLPEIVTRAEGLEGEEALARARNSLPRGVKAETFRLTGIPADTILQFAKEKNSRLIVLGGRGLSPMEGFFLGSVSQSVMEKATVSVLVVK